MNESDVFKIGQVMKMHGFKGKLELSLTDDIFGYADIDYLFFKIEGLLVPFFVESYTPKGNNKALIKLDDVDDVTSAQKLLNAEIYFPYSEIPERETENNTWEHLIGYKIEDIHEGYIGDVTDVNTQSANTLLFVKTKEGKEIMIPLHPELIKEYDEKQREILMDLPEGLLLLND